MKYIIAFILLVMPLSDLDKIATVNKHKKEAREAYNNGDYATALSHYRYLIDSLQVEEPEVMLNMANTLYQLKDTTRAIERYASLYDTPDKTVRSVANQQLGVVYNKMLQKPEMALEYFKQALKDDPTNEDARYNYELLKKALKDKEKQEQDQQDQDQDKKEQQQKDKQEQDQQDQQQKDSEQEQKQDQPSDEKKQDQEGKEGEENQEEQSKDQEQQKDDPSKDPKEQQKKEPQEGEPDENDDQENQDQQNSVAEKLKDMKISEEKARMILEAMKNNEIQYFQQNKRKPTKKKDTSKPDW